MADVGLDAELELDVARALRAVGDVEQATDRASRIVLQADTRQVTSSIEAALASLDTQLTITGEARDVTTSVDAAVNAADTQLTLFGDAGDITGSIDAAVQAADTDVDLDVTAPGLPKVEDDLHKVDRAADGAAESSGRLKGALAAISAVAVARGIYEVVQAASDLEESTSKASVVFGESFGAIEDYSRQAATAVGLSTAEALEATATFGNLFQALGSTTEVAADLSPQVVTLAADLASFNNLGVDETLEKLRSGLVGEVEPLRALGVSFTAAEVEAKAMELGLAGANGEVDEGGKLQARFALIMEQTSLAQGDFARTSDGLANQQRILTAEFKNAVTEIGVGLLPSFKDLVGSGRDLIPVFVEFAQQVLPPLVDIIATLLPLGGSFLTLVTALGPVISVVASAVASVPEPLIVMVGAMVAANRALGGLGSAIPQLVSNLAKMQTALLSANPVVLGLAATVGFAAALFAKNAAEQAAYRREVEEVTTALRDQDGVLRVTTDSLAGYVETQSRFDSRNQADDLERMGLGFTDVAELSRQGAEGLQAFTIAALRANEAQLTYNGQTYDLIDAQNTFNQGAEFTADQLSTLADGYVITSNGTRLMLGGNSDLIGSFEELQSATKDAAEQELTRLALTDDATAAIVDQARETNTLADGTVDAVGALDDVNAMLDKQAHEAEAAALAETELADRQAELSATSDEAAAAANRIAAAIAGVSSEANLGFPPTIDQVTALAVALQQGAATETEMQDAADALGVSVDNLQSFVDSTTASFEAFADAGVNAFPTIADAIGTAMVEIEDGSEVFSLENFRDELQRTVDAAQAFPVNVQFLVSNGFTELAAIAPQLGADVTAGIVEGIASGDPAVAQEVEGLLAIYGDTLGPGGTLPTFLANTAAPTIALATGDAARLAAEAFGPAFDLLDPATQEMVATQLAVQSFANPMATDAGAVGSGAAAALLDQFGVTPAGLSGILDAATGSVQRESGAIGGAASGVGAAGATGFEGGFSPVVGSARDIISSTGGVFGEAKGGLQSVASSTGYGVGQAFGEGIRDGIDSYVGRIRSAAANAVNEAEAAARLAADSNSPSKLFAAVGEDMGEGIVVGLDAAASSIAAASSALVAVAAAPVVAPDVARVAPFGDGGAGATTVTIPVVVHVNGRVTESEAKAIGEGIGGGISTELARRQIIVSARTQ